LQENSLTLDELESIRLADLQHLYQEDAAERMGVSRQTFGNIIRSAHEKIADALVNAKSLRIAGGVVLYGGPHPGHGRCRHGWTPGSGRGLPPACPQCLDNAMTGKKQDADPDSPTRPTKEKQP
jgi:hypothetical protein